jgi:Tol biopolymer transport system component
MIAQNELDRLLSTWLSEEAPSAEPEELLPRSLLHVSRTRRQPAWLTVLRGTSMGRVAAPAPRLVVILVLMALLVITLLGGVLIGSSMRGPIVVAPPSPAPTFGSSLPPVLGLPGRFAFASNRDGDLDVYAMDPDRTNLAQLTNDPDADVSPLWSPDGGRIAFASNRNGNQDIFVMNADGTALNRLTSGIGDEAPGAWSPDGTEIAYATDLGVRIVKADGGNDREVVTTAQLKAVYEVSGWMPAGDELLMVLDKTGVGGQGDIYRVRIADGRQTQLTTTPGDDGTPVISPDGSRIAFQSDRNGGCLFLMDADGSNVVRLTSRCSKGFPKAWAPDGSLIGWAGARRPDHDQPWDISVVRPDGSGQTQLTDSQDVVDLAWGPSH